MGDVYPEKVKEHYGDGSKFGVKVTYVYQDQPRGIAHAVGLCGEFVGGEPFVVYLGDNLLKGGISKFVEFFERNNFNAMVLLCEVKNPERFGVAKFDSSGKLVQLIEKPKQPPSNHALTGIYFFRPVVFDAIRQLKPSWRRELEITEAIQLLLEKGPPVHHQFVEGWWKDTGTHEDILDANRLVLDDLKPKIIGEVEEDGSIQGRVLVDEEARIKRGATIRGPAVIGKEALIEGGVYIGPYTSIGNRVNVKRGEIENSIIMDDSLIEVDEKITDSIVGSGSEITSGKPGRPKGRTFIIGDKSRIVL